MKAVKSKRVVKVLTTLNLNRVPGRGGHALWGDASGRTVSMSFHRTDIPIACLYSMGREMEAKGIVTRTEFVRQVLGR